MSEPIYNPSPRLTNRCNWCFASDNEVVLVAWAGWHACFPCLEEHNPINWKAFVEHVTPFVKAAVARGRLNHE